MQTEPQPLQPLSAGELALRFKIEWVGSNPWAGIEPTKLYMDTKAVVRGLEVIQVISQENSIVKFTNFKKTKFSKNGQNCFVGKIHRSELISLNWFTSFLPISGPAECAVPIMVDSETNP